MYEVCINRTVPRCPACGISGITQKTWSHICGFTDAAEPRPQGISTQNFVPISPAVPEICSRTNRHTDRQTNWSQYSAPPPGPSNRYLQCSYMRRWVLDSDSACLTDCVSLPLHCRPSLSHTKHNTQHVNINPLTADPVTALHFAILV